MICIVIVVVGSVIRRSHLHPGGAGDSEDAVGGTGGASQEHQETQTVSLVGLSAIFLWVPFYTHLYNFLHKTEPILYEELAHARA